MYKMIVVKIPLKRMRKMLKNKRTIRQKLILFSSIVFLVVTLAMALSVWTLNFSLLDFRQIVEENNVTTELTSAVRTEAELFNAYMKNGSDEKLRELTYAIAKTNFNVKRLPADYSNMNEERIAYIQAFTRAYEVYESERDSLIRYDGDSQSQINRLYAVYEMQDYLIQYAARLIETTAFDGTQRYQAKVPVFRQVTWLVLAIATFLLAAVAALVVMANRTIINPVLKLADASKKIADNDFSVEDVVVASDDEVGELVNAFNKMKNTTGQYISSLEEQRQTRELLYKEQVEKLKMQKQLNAINLELLKSQIKPHFLFNTLNVIAGMANLEDAVTTEKMINALSSIFRYNLKTPGVFVPLYKDLKVLDDYMYLQKMRFGERVKYSITCNADEENEMVPSFMLQPLVENAIIHGVCPKIEGGQIDVLIEKIDAKLHIVISDTGVGIGKEKLESIKAALKGGKDNESGTKEIGIENVYDRIKALYDECTFEITSTEGIGTTIDITLSGERNTDNENTGS